MWALELRRHARLIGRTDNGSHRTGADTHLRPWLTHGQSALTAFRGGLHPIAQSAAGAEFGAVDQLSMVNVAIQVEHSRRTRSIVDAHREGLLLNVIGLFYDISGAQVLQVDLAGVSTVGGQPAADAK